MNYEMLFYLLLLVNLSQNDSFSKILGIPNTTFVTGGKKAGLGEGIICLMSNLSLRIINQCRWTAPEIKTTALTEQVIYLQEVQSKKSVSVV